jgi:glycosyltransferase involved in cell wall biosynthesis
MKILMISPQFRPLVGGYERACERLAIALAEEGHSVTVCAERRSNLWPKNEELQGVHLHRWWCRVRPGWHIATSLIGLLVTLLRHGRSHQVWHVHQYGMHAALVVAIGKLFRRPVLLKLTGTKEQGIAHTIANDRFPAFSSALHRQVDAVVALTQETAAEAEAFGIPVGRIHVLGNGVDTECFRPRGTEERGKLKHKLGLGDASVVLFVGGLVEAKNIEGLMQAWQLVVSRLSKRWLLVVVGAGPLLGSGQQLAKAYCITDRTRFVGQQPNVEEWMGASDIYVSTSWREGLSNTLLEAMATGLPVVATRVSGVREAIEASGAGLAVEIGDMDGLANSLIELANDRMKQAECGANGVRTVVARYSIGVVQRRQETLYRQLLSQ